MPSMLLTIPLAAVILAVGLIPVRAEALMFLQAALGFGAYVALALLLRFKPLAEFASMLLPRVQKRSESLARKVEWVKRRCA